MGLVVSAVGGLRLQECRDTGWRGVADDVDAVGVGGFVDGELVEDDLGESCGKCTPCREGTYWLELILQRMVAGHGTETDIDTLLDVCDNILGRAFCALGDGATSPITSAIEYFRHEFLDLIVRQPASQPGGSASVMSGFPVAVGEDQAVRTGRGGPGQGLR